jgi:hypothetical protein
LLVLSKDWGVHPPFLVLELINGNFSLSSVW